jgi:uncharacterized protein (TIGR03066 family)
MFSPRVRSSAVLVFAVMFSLLLTANADDALQKRIVGTWLEKRFETKSKTVKESDNLVTFSADGGLKLHLKKGEKGDQRSLDGTWKMEGDGKLKMELLVDGEKNEQSMTVSFEGEEMVFTDSDGRRTWHSRHEGPLPERYQ